MDFVNILIWILTAIFGLGILFVRQFKMAAVLGYVLLVVFCITFALFEFIQLSKMLDPAWTGAAVAVSLIVLVRVSFWIKPVKHSKKDVTKN